MPVFTENESGLLTSKQLMQQLGICECTLINWKKNGRIPFIAIGGIVRFELPKVMEALRAYENQVNPKPRKPEKFGVHRNGLVKRDAQGRLLKRSASAASTPAEEAAPE